MNTKIISLLIALVIGIAIGCGISRWRAAYIVLETPVEQMDMTTMHDHSTHTHDTRDLAGENNIPSVALVMHEDLKSGWNAQIVLTDFVFAPERASTEHVEGEGHAHIYVDGVKLNRVYGEWYYLGDLPPGEHEVMVQLSSNDHKELVVEGMPIAATTTIVVPTGDAMMMQ